MFRSNIREGQGGSGKVKEEQLWEEKIKRQYAEDV